MTINMYLAAGNYVCGGPSTLYHDFTTVNSADWSVDNSSQHTG